MDRERAKAVQVKIMTKLLDYDVLPPGPDGYPRFRPRKSHAIRRGMDKKAANEAEARRSIGVGIGLPDSPRKQNTYRIVLTCQRRADVKGPIVTAARKIVEEAGGDRKKDIEVIYSGRIRPAGTAKKKAETETEAPKQLQIGDSVGRRTGFGGAIGCFVTLAGQQGDFVLSNNHVLAKFNQGAPLDPILSPASQKIKDRVGSLHVFEPIHIGPGGENVVDCALALVQPGISCDRTQVHGLGAGPPKQLSGQVVTGALSSVEQVRKKGPATGATVGRVLRAGETFQMEVTATKQAWFTGQLAVKGINKPFAAQGDSGSVAFNANMDAVGLVCAVSDEEGLTYCNPIAEVLSKLGATL